MTRTLLPVFSKYSLGLNLDAKEPVETFAFLDDSERYDYEKFRSALDSIPGSREYLKSYEVPEGKHSFFDSIGNKIMCAAGDHHSGSSASELGWRYKELLNDWDGWVKRVKLHQAKDNYKNAQLERPSTWQFANASTDEGRKMGIQSLRNEFSLPYSDEEIAVMLHELISEFNEDRRLAIIHEEEDRFNERINILEHHYKYPERWNDSGQLSSSLFGSIHSITEPMFAAMEKKHPYYRSHIRNILAPHAFRCACGVCHNKRVVDGTEEEYYQWAQAEATAVLSRPPSASVTAKAISAIDNARNMPGGNTDDGFLSNLLKTVQGINQDSKCPHGHSYYTCISCPH
jgi:hypothetical protein